MKVEKHHGLLDGKVAIITGAAAGSVSPTQSCFVAAKAGGGGQRPRRSPRWLRARQSMAQNVCGRDQGRGRPARCQRRRHLDHAVGIGVQRALKNFGRADILVNTRLYCKSVQSLTLSTVHARHSESPQWPSVFIFEIRDVVSERVQHFMNTCF